MIIGGFSAYSGVVDWAKMREIADSIGAYLFVDMAHVAGLVAAGVYPNPVPHAHVVTTTTHKTLAGPRGGLIPAISYLGPAFAAMITGSFVVETCFQVPGMGQHFVNATTDRDYFLIQGLVLFYGILIVAANLAVDLVQMAVNPRLRAES